ncbi:hypothetical protein CEUSTIGMA_g8214.t1 [Chlamydomonas eustigma]|uniref:ENT domain-containing protein n=1 Tax=Chlamydomonas eustigma TaxID=1157962 RepID=A0A250XCH4_9CHLO|nr:hypothetical protein CEUSTIGMA_g8214.t1 [Chlamydomonas eustigma]|eukprot:GAX80778.1 hypothetical protein CEUSTIGMA_g8214.t1 [Chlamydomonas eustigma]
MQNREQQRALEASSYYAVVKALYACRRLDQFENELLLADLQKAFQISAAQHLDYLNAVKGDEEANALASFPAEASNTPPTTVIPRPVIMPPTLAIPQFEPQYQNLTPLTFGKSKNAKKSTSTPKLKGGISKSSSLKKSNASTPASTPRSSKSKPALERRASLHDTSIQMHTIQAAHAELQRLTNREREIFEALIKMGVKDDDPDLNPVHKTLLKWYKLDTRQREIERELEALG